MRVRVVRERESEVTPYACACYMLYLFFTLFYAAAPMTDDQEPKKRRSFSTLASSGLDLDLPLPRDSRYLCSEKLPWPCKN